MKPLTPAERAAIKAKIVRLTLVYEEILEGKGVKRFVDQNGEQVEYSTANADKLWSYILDLKKQVDPRVARAYRPRPIGFLFPR